MPSIVDVNISDVPEIYRFTFIINMEGEEGPEFQYFGSELATTFGQDYSGIPLEEALLDTMVDNTIGFYEKVLESKQPHSESSEFFIDGKECRYRSIILPCSSNDFNVDFLIGTTNYKIFD